MSDIRTGDEREEVAKHLKSTGGWWTATPPDYDAFSRAEMSKKLEQVRDAVLVNTNAARTAVEAAHDRSQDFITSAFDFYEGRKGFGGKIGRAFVVPMRSDRVDERYASESTPFCPLLDPDAFGVTSEIRMRCIYGLPPTVLDTYLKSDCRAETGALVLAPLYADMAADIWSDPGSVTQATKLSATVDRLLADTMRFVHLQLGADYVGLGATLPHPTITDFGRKIRALPDMANLVTTTGHGGTVHMIAQTVEHIISETVTEFDGTVGLLGAAGSIGWSSVLALHGSLPSVQLHVFDTRAQRMRDLLDNAPELDRVAVADSVRDVLLHNRLVVSAITEMIDLESAALADIDLTGMVWIDDSQPGSVDRNQLERRGGKVIWVAGTDKSPSQFMTRDGHHTRGLPYDYGSASGLYGTATEFACGLEAAVVAASRHRSNAVSGPVLVEDARRIGRLFDQFGVTIAPYQSFGEPVALATTGGPALR